jgi:hypothetical protein
MPERIAEAEVCVVNGALMTGLVALPAIFVWFLLLPGYANSLRKAVFLYAFGPAAVFLVATVIDGLVHA